MEVIGVGHVYVRSVFKGTGGMTLFGMMKNGFSWASCQESAGIQQSVASFKKVCVGMYETTLLAPPTNSDIGDGLSIYH